MLRNHTPKWAIIILASKKPLSQNYNFDFNMEVQCCTTVPGIFVPIT